MELFKLLNEKLPALLVIVAIAIFFSYEHFALILLAALVYVISCRIWIIRSEHRRNNYIKKTLPRFRIPQSLYEWYPYVFLAVAMVLIKYFQYPGAIAFALMLILVACKTLYVRRQSRFYSNRIHY